VNILMLHPHDIYSNLEPWTVRVTYLAHEFVKRGHHVRLLYHLIDETMNLDEANERQEYPFTTIPAYRYQMALLGKMGFVKDLAIWADVIHFQKCFPHVSIPSIWGGYRVGKPVHYDWDDWEYGIYNYAPGNRIVGATINSFEKIVPKMVDSVSYASLALKERALALGVPESRLFEAHVGADIDKFHPGIDGSEVRDRHHIEGPIVLYLGQLHGAQYLELFLKACAKVLPKRPDATCVVVGSGERFGELFKLAEDLGIAHKTVFTGAVDHEEIPKYIAAADVAVACFEETSQTICKSPLKVVEYMAMGKAIVASRMGEVPRMIGDAGILVPPGDADSLSDGILKLLADEGLRLELGRRARVQAETEYNWGVTAENLLTAYQMIYDENKWLNWKLKRGGEAPFSKIVSPAHGAKTGKPFPTEEPTKEPSRREATEADPFPGNEADCLEDDAPCQEKAPVATTPASNEVGQLDSEKGRMALDSEESRRDRPKVNIPQEILDELNSEDGDGKTHEIHGPLISTKLDRELPSSNGPKAFPKMLPPIGKLTYRERLDQFVESNRDVMGVVDGKRSYIGPYTVQIDPTNRCNNDCVACWCRSPLLLDKALPPEKRSQTLPFEIIRDLIDDVVAMETKEIYIAGGGEPFCHPNILEIIEYIKKSGLICNINTNFTLVDREVAEFLAQMRVEYMTVSVWAGTAETYADVHPNKPEETFYDIKDSLAHLNRVKDQFPLIKVYNVISNLNYHEILAMIDFALETNSESVEFTVLDTIPGRTDFLLVSEEERAWLYEEACKVKEWIVGKEKESRLHLFKYDQFLRRISGEHTTSGEHDKTIIDSMPCTVGWLFARVLADGNVNSCLKSHRIPTGSLYEKSFRELWTGSAQHCFRNKTNVFVKDDPFFSMIGNDPDAECGCYKSCDDLGRIEHMHARVSEMPTWQKAVLKSAQLYYRAAGRYIKPERS
jgi:glycosyltransferase involved in cell wall biosynthesis/MoaA/NifB/PqqE/SkfB family radical SAM enzyme